MAETTIKISAGYKDFSTRNYEFGPFSDDSERLGAIYQHPKTELAKLTPFFNKTVSILGEEFGEIVSAEIVSMTKKKIF